MDEIVVPIALYPGLIQWESIFDLWMACHTQEEIAEAVNLTQQAVALSTSSGNFSENCKTSATALHQTDFAHAGS